MTVVLLLLAIVAIPVNVHVIGIPFNCHENAVHPDILSNSTIKGGEFSSCHSAVNVSFRERLHYLPISAYNVSCGSLITYREHIQVNETIDYLKDEPLPVYDCSTSSCYFARGFSAQVSVSADAPGGARISVCWFTNESDYTHFLGIGENDILTASGDTKDRECLKVLEFSRNGTEFKNTVTIKNMLPSYYYVGIRVEKELTSLWYNFTTERGFYNRSDFGKTPDCIISHTDPLCNIQLSGEACIMLYADPEPNANSSSYYLLALNGQKKHGQKWKDGVFIALWVLIVIFPVVSIIIIILVLYRLFCRKGK